MGGGGGYSYNWPLGTGLRLTSLALFVSRQKPHLVTLIRSVQLARLVIQARPAQKLCPGRESMEEDQNSSTYLVIVDCIRNML